MRRGSALAAAVIALVALTGCGPAGSLAPPSDAAATPEGPPSSPASTGSASTPTPTPTPVPTQPNPTVAPPITQPAQPALPEVPRLAPFGEIPIGGPHTAPGQRFDIAIACSVPLPIVFDGTGDAAGIGQPGGARAWCETSTALVVQRGVPAEHARVWMRLEDDVPAPLAISVPAGEPFDADALARLAAAAGSSSVKVSVECLEPGDFTLAGEVFTCDPVLWGAGYFETPVTFEQAFTELVLPEGYAGTVTLYRA